MQVVQPPAPVALPVVDLRALPAADREAEAVRLATAEAVRPYDLARGPLVRFTLVRLGDDDHRLFVALHHLVFDGVAVYRVFLPELIALYAAFAAGRPSPLPEPPIQYADYAVWQRQWLEGGRGAAQLAYWRRKLADLPPLLSLPTDRPRPAAQSFRGAQHPIALPADLTGALRALSRRERVSLFMTLLAAFQTLLHRYSGQDDLVVGTVSAGRKLPELEGLLGYFLNPLALRMDLGGDPTFRELLARARDVCLEALAHDDVPFDRVLEEVRPGRDAGRHPVFQAVLALEPPLPPLPPGWDLTQMDVEIGATKFDLYVELDERADTIIGRFMYRTDLFDRPTIERMVGHYRRLLEAAAADPGRRLSALPLLTEPERRQVLVEWNRTAAPYPQVCVHDAFAAQAAARPEAVAVVHEERRLTYGELDRRANALAHRLQALGVGPDVPVGVCLERSPELLVALLGVLKAGGAYLPLDPGLPGERLEAMLAESRAPALLTRPGLLARLPAGAPPALCVDEVGCDACEAAPATAVTPDHLAYVTYTSGSTGRPKGVAVPHRAVLRLLFGQDYVRLGPAETLLQLAPVAFDASTFEIWGALLHGGRCVLFPGQVPTARALGATIRRHQVTTAFLTTALFNSVVDDAPEELAGLRQLLFGGEAVSVAHVRRALERLPGTALIHVYGPTECTTFSTAYRVAAAPAPAATTVPIGRPIANTQAYVLDRHRQPVPVGVPGELFLGGPGLARGYLHRPDLTAEAFVPHPWDARPGARLYRTGDLVRRRPDGALEFLGRIDGQVKIRGFRIEPAEVEAALVRHPDVREAAVVAREDVPGRRLLVAYVAGAGRPLRPADLRAFLRRTLPPYMIPSAFVTVPALPLTPSGKVDRRALPAPGTARPDGERPLVAPRDLLEAQLAEMWEELLGLHPVGVQDDFFDLGGHSLLAVQVVRQVEALYGRALPLTALYAEPTVEGLARLLRREADVARAPVIRIHEGGRRRPLFFFHGDLAGGGFYSLKLARRLGPDQPFYVVQSLGQDGDGAPRSIEDMAAVHLLALRAVQPRGPYRLGGYCHGGLVAYEIARRLAAAGERVELLVLVAATPWVRFARLRALGRRLEPWLGPARLHEAFARFRSFAWRLERLPLRARPAFVARELGRLVRRAAGESGAGGDTTYDHYFRAVMGYVPPPYPGRIVLVWPEEEPGAPDDPTQGWRRLVGGVDVLRVPGDHSTAVAAHVAALAERLRPYLERPDG